MPKVLDGRRIDVLALLTMTEEGKDLVALLRTNLRAAKAKVEAARKKHGTHVATARALGMSRSRLYSLMREVGL